MTRKSERKIQERLKRRRVGQLRVLLIQRKTERKKTAIAVYSHFFVQKDCFCSALGLALAARKKGGRSGKG